MEDKSLRQALFFFQKSSAAANMAVKNGTIYEFADFRLIPEDNLLQRGGESVPLPPKAFSTLVLLLEQHGHLVRKEELIEKIWADAFVEEAAVSRCIWTVRNALGEDSKSQRFIQTVPKRGYKFVADVTERRDADPPRPESHGHEMGSVETLPEVGLVDKSGGSIAEVRPISTRLSGNGSKEDGARAPELRPLAWYQERPVAASAALFVLLGLVVISASFLYKSQSSAARDRTQFAVLPVTPIDAANRSDIFENGIADSLINRLNSVHGFVARPLSATRKYTALDQDPIQAGREQKVEYVLASHYQIADGKIRVTSQLYDVESGKVLDTYRIEQDAANIFGAQDAIAADFGNRMMTRFAATLADRPATRGTSNEEAYSHYQQAQYLLAQTRKKGIESLEKAVAADPNYARAWGALAYAYTGGFDAAGPDKDEFYRKSIEAANKALSLEPGLSEAYSALCINRMFYERNVAGAEDVCKQAVDLDPNSATAHAVYAIFLSTRARHDEARAEIRTAMELEPGSYFPRRWHANFLYWAGRYDEAIVEVKGLIKVNPDDISRHRWLMWSYENQGKYPEAFEALSGLLVAYQKDEAAVQRFKSVFETSGWRGVLIELEKEEGLRFNSYRRAAMNSQIGNRDKAFELLEDAYASRLWEMAFLQVDPAFDPIRDDPRYAELVKRLESK
jgi:DNA-binding winged helix-turn-helix (wHTH) protein/TolB-like protein/Tfp pilus assembly protein PilF